MPTLRVMIVEKDRLIAGLWAELMASIGHEVCAIETAGSGAVMAACREKPDLLIVDGRLREARGAAFGPGTLLTSGLQADDFEVDLVAALEMAFGSFDRRVARSVDAGAVFPGFSTLSLM